MNEMNENVKNNMNITVEEWLKNTNSIIRDIWDRKYKYNDETLIESLLRISNNNEELLQLMIERKFLPGGRIIANRGLQKDNKKVTYSNCYVITPPNDSIEEIWDCAKKLARTYSYGGGCGVDLSKLAPRDSQVNNAAKKTSGSVSFMDLYSLTTGLIGQNGRRGALMLSLDCNHPDIEEFIGVKSDLDKVTKANISVKIYDDFMNAVEEDKDYELTFYRPETDHHITKTVNARKLFDKIAKMNWDYAEPGCLFWDKVTNWNLLSEIKDFEYAGTNPCAEEPLPAGGSCLLGSMNLSEFVINEFTDDAKFDLVSFEKAIRIAVRALDEILDEGLELHPLVEQRQAVRDWRQIGLGIMGLADMFIKFKMRYGSYESTQLSNHIANFMIIIAIDESAELAKKYGKFPKCVNESIVKSGFFKCNLDEMEYQMLKYPDFFKDIKIDIEEIKNKVLRYGLRNSQLLTIAPTGTISTLLGVSGGIEPIYANYYIRRTQSLYKEEKSYKVFTPICKQYMEFAGLTENDPLPDFFVESKDISYEDRILMQSVWQASIDAAISSTVNVPNDFTVEQTKDLYKMAYECGLKGITIYRAGCKREPILSTEENVVNNVVFDSITPVSRHQLGTTTGNTYCKKSSCGTLYITLNKNKEGNIVECFTHTSKSGICQANISAVNRLVSLALRSGVKVSEIIDQLKGINCPACLKSKSANKLDGLSCPDIIARTLEQFALGDIEPCDCDEETLKEYENIVSTDKSTKDTADDEHICPECGNLLEFREGCVSCPNCAWSKCSL